MSKDFTVVFTNLQQLEREALECGPAGVTTRDNLREMEEISELCRFGRSDR